MCNRTIASASLEGIHPLWHYTLVYYYHAEPNIDTPFVENAVQLACFVFAYVLGAFLGRYIIAENYFMWIINGTAVLLLVGCDALIYAANWLVLMQT